MIGRTLGHYEIIERLGRGGMGDVYAARDTRLNREVAIKILPEEFAARPDRRERFEREAKTVAQISHPNIVTIHSVEEADGHPFIVMEIVRGQTLGELIPEGGMPLEQFFRIALPLTDAIHAAHMRGVSHRDLKPNNVMVGESGRVKVLDFGLAKVMEPDTDPDGLTRATSNLTAEGRILGTVAYMSPEQAEGKALDHRSDLFSLGILLYEMLTGVRPFLGDTDISVLSSILKDSPRPLNDLRSELPLALQRIVGRALEKSPERRYQSAADLRRDLEDLKRDMDTGELVALAGRGEPRPGAGRWLLPVAVLGIVALLAGAVWMLRGDDAEPDAMSGSGGPSGAATAGGDTAAVGAPLPRSDARPSVAVFYFDNLSGDEELAWLHTGLTDMLVTQLSQSPSLRVLGTDRLYQLLDSLGARSAATTSFDTVSAVAEEAGISTAVLGSFLREGERLRISARIQDVRDGRVLWSETVEGRGDESILDLVDTLAERIRSTFELPARPSPDTRVAADEPRDLRQVSTDSLVAWKHFTEGLRLEAEEGAEAAIPKLEQALEADPEFATALAKLSELHAAAGHTDMSAEYATRAMEKSERLPMAERMFLEGRVRIFEPREIGAGIEALEKAVTAFPEHRSARADLAGALLTQDRVQEAIGQLERIREHDDMDVRVAKMLAHAYASAGDVDRGRAVLQEHVGKRPDDAAATRALADFTLTWDRNGASEGILEEIGRRWPGESGAASLRWAGLVLGERWDQARTAAERLAQEPDPAARWQGHRQLAALELYRGRADEAIALLREGLATIPAGHPIAAGARVDAASMLIALPRPDDVRAILADSPERPSLSPLARLDALRLAAVAAAQAGDGDAVEVHTRAFRERLDRATLPEGLLEMEHHRLVGEVAAAAGRHADAVDELTQVVDEGPAVTPLGPPGPPGTPGSTRDRVTTRYLLAHALKQLGRTDAAVRHFRAVVDTGPDRAFAPVPYARSLFWLAGALAESGDEASAARYYRRFLELRAGGSLDGDLVQRAREALERMRPAP